MARRITLTEQPGADPEGTYATWVIDDDDTPVAHRHRAVQRDDHGRITVIYTAEDSISLRHLRDLAEDAMDKARRSRKRQTARQAGGRKSGLILSLIHI